MEPYQERVVEEKRALDEKLAKLEKFLFHNPGVLDVPKEEHLRMAKQYCHMMDYSNILAERIAAFK